MEEIDVFLSSRRRHTRCSRDWSSDVCSSDLVVVESDDLAVVVGEILGRMSRQVSAGRHLAVAEGDEEETVPVARQARAVMPGPSRRRHEDFLDVCEALLFE